MTDKDKKAQEINEVFRIETVINNHDYERLISEAFDHQWGQSKKRSKWMLAAGIIIVVVAAIALSQVNSVFSFAHLVLIGGTSYLFMGYNYLNQIQKTKKQYVESELKRLKEKDKEISSIVFEFSDAGFRQEDNEISLFMHWTAFSHYLLTDNNLYLYYKNGQLHPISKSYFANDQLTKIMQILSRNLKSDDAQEESKTEDAEELLDN